MKLDDIKNMEATYLDYKESLETTKPVSWLKSVVAFANTKGGHIIFGVTDEEHKFIGIDNLQQTSSKISELISTRVSPWPRFTLAPIDSEYSDKKCIDLEVAPGPGLSILLYQYARTCYFYAAWRSFRKSNTDRAK